MESQEPTRPSHGDSPYGDRSYGETMHARRTSMPDGRYLIYYTFDDAGPARSVEPPPAPEARPEMTEERDV